MATKINSKYVENLSKDEVARLLQLTLTGEDQSKWPSARMTPVLKGELAGWNDGRRRARAFMLKEDGVIVSWSLVFDEVRRYSRLYNSGEDRMTAYFYTLPDSRRKKYGARVAKAIEKWYGEKPYVDPWDPRSTAFFEDRKLKRQNY